MFKRFTEIKDFYHACFAWLITALIIWVPMLFITVLIFTAPALYLAKAVHWIYLLVW